ncbi:Y-family DNA polymerase [Acaryochloris sp. CCMEE 5410]|uniref:Y-family DNA polymerase n=1 Tax=Acaryochloris sp. CCMEE 5410 TaxID=310037 RepID=UPI001F460B11|nr:Y-family DNA polymerase [Acaryochloris sp. CCMEE 5410]
MDCDNFYVSCEKNFKPAWKDHALGVLSNNDGCLVARSHELKAAGIPMGAPYFKYRKELQALDAILVSSNYALYGDMSARVMTTLGQFTPELEIYSIDEAWLNLTGFELATLDAYAREIVATTKRHTGIPVSMGIGPTKVLAKIANRICKRWAIPGQVFNIGSAESLDGILTTIQVEDIWGIGRQWAKKLEASGIYTAKDLREADDEQMRRRYNVVMQRLILELRGISCLGIDQIAPKKQIIVSRSFGERVEDLDSLLQAVAMHATRAGEKLRSQDSECGAIQVSIRTGRHNPKEKFFGESALVRFPVATADTRKLICAAQRGVKQIYKKGPRYAKAGVMLLDISPTNVKQQNLFCEGDSQKATTLMQIVDQLNDEYGRKTVFFASEGMHQTWAMKRRMMTQAYTTQWSDVPVVH